MFFFFISYHLFTYKASITSVLTGMHLIRQQYPYPTYISILNTTEGRLCFDGIATIAREICQNTE